jgi:hypothetical protein
LLGRSERDELGDFERSYAKRTRAVLEGRVVEQVFDLLYRTVQKSTTGDR